MEIIIVSLAGIIGTFIMTMFMFFVSKASGYNFRVPLILGNIITMQKKPLEKTSDTPKVLVAGNLVHYGIGILLAFAYQWGLRMLGWPNTFSHSFLFGVAAGCCAVPFWFMLIKLHPFSPAIELPVYLTAIFIAHLFFASGVWLGFVIMG